MIISSFIVIQQMDLDVLSQELKVMIHDFFHDHLSPLRKEIQDQQTMIHQMISEKQKLIEDLKRMETQNQLLTDRLIKQEEEIESFTSVSVIKAWEKKLHSKERDVDNWKSKCERLENYISSLHDSNYLLNDQLERLHTESSEKCMGISVSVQTEEDVTPSIGPLRIECSTKFYNKEKFMFMRQYHCLYEKEDGENDQYRRHSYVDEDGVLLSIVEDTPSDNVVGEIKNGKIVIFL